MKELVLEIFGNSAYKPIVTIDGERCQYENGAWDKGVIHYATDKDKVSVSITKTIEINTRFWLLWQIFYYIISLFGLLDFRPDKKGISYTVQFDIDLISDYTVASVRLLKQKRYGLAANIKANSNIHIGTNRFYIDPKAKKHRRILVLMEFLILIAAIVALILALALSS